MQNTLVSKARFNMKIRGICFEQGKLLEGVGDENIFFLDCHGNFEVLMKSFRRTFDELPLPVKFLMKNFYGKFKIEDNGRDRTVCFN